jgi:hypothetical protein
VVPAGALDCLWRRLDVPGLEWCRFEPGEIRGRVVVQLEGKPCAVEYSVRRDRHWRSRGARITLDDGGRRRQRVLQASGGRWLSDGRELLWARGLPDLDLGVTPSTNTLPIRRLRLPVGAAAELTAIWVRFPGLEVRPLAQRYTRLDRSTYRYQSLVDGVVRFTARIVVDQRGRVERYAGLFERVG